MVENVKPSRLIFVLDARPGQARPGFGYGMSAVLTFFPTLPYLRYDPPIPDLPGT